MAGRSQGPLVFIRAKPPGKKHTEQRGRDAVYGRRPEDAPSNSPEPEDASKVGCPAIRTEHTPFPFLDPARGRCTPTWTWVSKRSPGNRKSRPPKQGGQDPGFAVLPLDSKAAFPPVAQSRTPGPGSPGIASLCRGGHGAVSGGEIDVKGRVSRPSNPPEDVSDCAPRAAVLGSDGARHLPTRALAPGWSCCTPW